MHYFAHLVVCWIGRIQPSDPLLPTFYVGKESPVSRTTTVADPVKVGGGQDFQSGWRLKLLTPMCRLAGLHGGVEPGDLLGERGSLARPVQEQKVDVVGTQLAQAFVHRSRKRRRTAPSQGGRCAPSDAQENANKGTAVAHSQGP